MLRKKDSEIFEITFHACNHPSGKHFHRKTFNSGLPFSPFVVENMVVDVTLFELHGASFIGNIPSWIFSAGEILVKRLNNAVRNFKIVLIRNIRLIGRLRKHV